MSVYLDRLRDERRSINNKVDRMRGKSPHFDVESRLLIVRAITNLTDTIQTIHEDREIGE